MGDDMKIDFRYDDKGYYEKTLGDDEFSKAVNKKISDYWVQTGTSLNPIIACLEVLGEQYNKNN